MDEKLKALAQQMKDACNSKLQNRNHGYHAGCECDLGLDPDCEILPRFIHAFEWIELFSPANVTALIDGFETCEKSLVHDLGSLQNLNNKLQSEIASLREQLAARSNEWIPVGTQMPPAGRNVAIMIEDASVSIHDWVTAGYYHSVSGGWWHGTPGDYRSCRDQRWTVTYWAHLPAKQCQEGK